MALRRLLLLVPVAAAAHGQGLTPGRIADLRQQIRRNFYIPSLPRALEAQVHRRFAPAPGVKAEAVSYATEFGTRVPAILYLPDPLPAGNIPALVIVTGHAEDKYSWYSYYAPASSTPGRAPRSSP